MPLFSPMQIGFPMQEFKKNGNFTIPVAKTKALISFAVTAKLICAFVLRITTQLKSRLICISVLLISVKLKGVHEFRNLFYSVICRGYGVAYRPRVGKYLMVITSL